MKIRLKKVDKLKIFYKLFFSLLVFGFVLSGWIINLNSLHANQDIYMQKHNNKASYFLIDGYTNTAFYFSFFTIQTNIFCLSFMFLAAIFHKKEDKIWFLKNKIALMITIYITITFLIFNTMLLPLVIAQNLFTNAYQWIDTIVMHVICPISFIYFYLRLFNREQKINKNYLYKKQIPMTVIYPLVWFIFNMLKSILISSTVKNSIVLKNKLDLKQSYYQYFFMNLTGKTFGAPNYIWFFIALIFILSIIIGLSYLYNKFCYVKNNINN